MRTMPRRHCILPLLGSLLALGSASQAMSDDPHPEWSFFAPFASTDTFVIDLDGNVVHTWPSNYTPGASVYLTDDGAIIRTANDPSVQEFGGPGLGGRIERIAWDGTLEWSYVVGDSVFLQHHDIAVISSSTVSNGNILILAWERFTAEEAIAMGRDPDRVGIEVWAEAIFEVVPIGSDDADVVWEWHVWDHLVQDFDPELPNYGVPSENPGRFDINYGPTEPDWLHCNAIDYNLELDQIVISSRTWSEVWIISHDSNDSGEIIYRWGNPEAYGRGDAEDRKLFGQHDPEWIPEGIKGAGHLTVYNNGVDRGYSSVDEIDTGVNLDGTYDLPKSGPFGPADIEWTCDTIDGEQFFSGPISGVQRLKNGNHLICVGTEAEYFEVDEDCNSVWSYDAVVSSFRVTRFDRRDERLEGLLWIPGDADGDLDVDLADLLLVLIQWGTDGPEGDLDGNGIVNLADLLLLLGEWTG